MEVVRVLAQMALGVALPWWLQRLDRKRLTREQRARSWNTATWGSALYAFGPLSLLGWGWVTRKRLWGLLGGLAAALLVALAMAAVDAVLFGE
jgi:hypothetical protein